MAISQVSNAQNIDISRIGWRYYNHIKKKAMEQEFSWTGLVLSLSIAFFIVIASSICLSFLYSLAVETDLLARLY